MGIIWQLDIACTAKKSNELKKKTKYQTYWECVLSLLRQIVKKWSGDFSLRVGVGSIPKTLICGFPIFLRFS